MPRAHSAEEPYDDFTKYFARIWRQYNASLPRTTRKGPIQSKASIIIIDLENDHVSSPI